MDIDKALSAVTPADQTAYARCRERFDSVAKPVGSLGRLETLLARIAAITGTADIDIGRKAVAVFCADNGVVKHGVALHGHEVTTAVAGLLGIGKSSVSVMAEACGADVFAIDVGMTGSAAGIQACKLMHGTNDITQGPAMNRKIAEEAVAIGIRTVEALKAKGYRLIATGEVGIGNTTTSSAVCSLLLNRPVREVTGRGAGLDDAGLARKIAAIEQAIAVNQPEPSDPMEVLHMVGGLDIAALCGVFLGGAIHKTPIVMDGFISSVAALLAVRLCRYAQDYILPSHESGEPGMRHILQALALSPILQAGMRLGEGSGAVMLFPILDTALAVYQKAATYADIQVRKDGKA